MVKSCDNCKRCRPRREYKWQRCRLFLRGKICTTDDCIDYALRYWEDDIEQRIANKDW